MTTQTHTTITGRIVTTTQRPGRCTEVTAIAPKITRCGRAATEIRCDPGLGREVEVECHCDAHGGAAADLQRLLGAWGVVAPDCVGGPEAVEEAGCGTLCSVHVYVVTRHENGRWLAALGIGGRTQQVRRQDRDAERARRAAPGTRGPGRRGGGSSWATRDEAEAAGVAAWRAAIDSSIAEITAARGGTLAWGMPVAPRAAPIVLHAERGQSAYAADRVRLLRDALPGSIIDRVAEDAATAIGPPRMATRIAVGRREVVVVDTDLVYLDRENWSHRSVAEIAAEVRA